MLKPDAFLTALLEKPAYNVVTLDAADYRGETNGFASAKVPCEAVEECERLQTLGFRLVDTNVTLQLSVSNLPGAGEPPVAGCTIRQAVPQDRQGIARVAGSSFRFSRFHLDPRVPNAAADAIKQRWAENYFLGKRGDAMVVAESGGSIWGFLLLLIKDKTIIVDLLAVSAEYQRRGVANALLRHAIATAPSGANKMVVGTQLANAPSLRTYEKIGFRICEAQYVFHYHGLLACPA